MAGFAQGKPAGKFMYSLLQARFYNRKLPMAELSLLMVAIFWGTSYGLTKEALVYIPVLGFLTIRFLMTFSILLPILSRELRSGAARDWKYALPTGCILLSIFLCETYGVANTTASNAAFLISLCVLITPFIEWAVFKSYPGGKIFLQAMGCLLGVFLLSYHETEGVAFNQGDGFILLAALFRGFMVIVTRKLMIGRQLSSISLTAIQSGVVGSGALLLCLMINPETNLQIPMAPEFWLITLYLVLFCTIFAFFAQNYGVRQTSPSRVALLMGTEPAFGAAFAMLWLGEQLTGLQILGGLLIVVCATYSSMNRSSQK